jgi:hypothetical protein
LLELACKAYIKGQKPSDRIQKYFEEVKDVQMMCRTNMGGYWELEFLPYSGGFYEQPAHIIESIMDIINYVNKAIKRKQKEEDNKKT